jgi:hypothetical protein
MPEAIELLIHFVLSSIKLLKPDGVKVVMAETIAIKKTAYRNESRQEKITQIFVL